MDDKMISVLANTSPRQFGEAVVEMLSRDLRRNRMSQGTFDIAKAVIDHAVSLGEPHAECPAAVAVVVMASKMVESLVNLFTKFEDHMVDDHGGEERPRPTLTQATDRVEGNVIHVDLSKGRKN